MTNFGSGIWLYSRRTRAAILKFTVPATIIRSACRGVARKAPAPKRSMSKREAPVAIISMAQQARPNVMGHMLDSRAQLIACSSVVVITLSSKRPSSQPISRNLLAADDWAISRASLMIQRTHQHLLVICHRRGSFRGGGALGGHAAHPVDVAAL